MSKKYRKGSFKQIATRTSWACPTTTDQSTTTDCILFLLKFLYQNYLQTRWIIQIYILCGIIV